ncbi:thioredoxin domain-containing protein 2-like [Puma concolor]|uniref:Thioredoxin domain-containing protein 2-like n=1 Tax=Puma concolor TaxID=9696 RepID=A0A6P6HHM2_PUMCO|nr:thioredoxin domain-containing protein 2-like [Puma concolor]
MSSRILSTSSAPDPPPSPQNLINTHHSTKRQRGQETELGAAAFGHKEPTVWLQGTQAGQSNLLKMQKVLPFLCYPVCPWEGKARQIGFFVFKVVCQTPAAKIVKQIKSKYAFQEALNSEGNTLVVDFSATGCGPCTMVKSISHALSEKDPNVVCLEVDVGDCQRLFQSVKPTLPFLKKEQKVGEFSGTDKENLEATINEFI